jgi:hypothetical protein
MDDFPRNAGQVAHLMIGGTPREVDDDAQQSQDHEQLQTCPFDFAAPANFADQQKRDNGQQPNHRDVGEQQMNMGPIQQSRQLLIEIHSSAAKFQKTQSQRAQGLSSTARTTCTWLFRSQLSPHASLARKQIRQHRGPFL